MSDVIQQHPTAQLLENCNRDDVYSTQLRNINNKEICVACIFAIEQVRNNFPSQQDIASDTSLKVHHQLNSLRSNLVLLQSCLQHMELSMEHIDAGCEQVTSAIIDAMSLLNDKERHICTQNYTLSAGKAESGEDFWLTNNQGDSFIFPKEQLDSMLSQHFQTQGK